MLLLPADALAAVIAHCQIDYPNEACGIIAGPAGQPGTGTVAADRVIPIINISPDPQVGFRFFPPEQRAAYAAMDAAGEDPVVIYHSHPAGPAIPSPTDVDAAVTAGQTLRWLIVSLAVDVVVQCWRYEDGQAVEDELRILPNDPDSPPQPS